MGPAAGVVDKFGGASALAKLLGRSQSTVGSWVVRGKIPDHWHDELLALAGKMGIPLTPTELVVPTVPEILDKEAPATAIARWWGHLQIGGSVELPCYVLDDGRRVLSRAGATSVLSGNQGSGDLDSYLRVEALRGYLPEDLKQTMVSFEVPNNELAGQLRGITAETFIQICTSYVDALNDGALQTDRQRQIASQAAVLLASCAKVGLIALIDEATGYQYERAEDALRVKLRLFIEEEMRPWEKTFPDELWRQFGRLTNWRGSLHQRPKYWGHLVNELVYGYLDHDVAEWLKVNAPQPRHGRNYHQWMTEQYGLKKLIEHIWLLIGVASTCQTMLQLRQMMAERYGAQQVLFTTYIDPSHRRANPED